MAAPIAEPPHLAADLKTLCLSTITAQWRPLAEQATRQRQAPADYLGPWCTVRPGKAGQRGVTMR